MSDTVGRIVLAPDLYRAGVEKYQAELRAEVALLRRQVEALCEQLVRRRSLTCPPGFEYPKCGKVIDRDCFPCWAKWSLAKAKEATRDRA